MRILIWFVCLLIFVIVNFFVGNYIDLQFFPDGVIVADDRILANAFWNFAATVALLVATIYFAKKLCQKWEPYRLKNKSIKSYKKATSQQRQHISASVPEWYIEICEDKNKAGVIKKYLFESACKKVIKWEQFGCLYCEYVLFTKNKSA